MALETTKKDYHSFRIETDKYAGNFDREFVECLFFGDYVNLTGDNPDFDKATYPLPWAYEEDGNICVKHQNRDHDTDWGIDNLIDIGWPSENLIVEFERLLTDEEIKQFIDQVLIIPPKLIKHWEGTIFAETSDRGNIKILNIEVTEVNVTTNKETENIFSA